MTSGKIFKAACLVIYCAIVGGCTYWVYWRTGVGPHTKVVSAIAQNQLIKESDLRSVDQDSIEGRYARKAFTVGETIAPGDVAPAAQLTPANAIAAAVVIKKLAIAAPIGVGAALQLCLNGKPLGRRGHVVASVCDETNCLVAIPIEPFPKDVDLSKAADHLSAVFESDQCSPPAASSEAPGKSAAPD